MNIMDLQPACIVGDLILVAGFKTSGKMTFRKLDQSPFLY